MRKRLMQTAVALTVFGAGVAVGSLQAPGEAVAQSGTRDQEGDRRAILAFIRLSTIMGDREAYRIPSSCADVTVIPARVQSRDGQVDGVYVLCERR